MRGQTRALSKQSHNMHGGICSTRKSVSTPSNTSNNSNFHVSRASRNITDPCTSSRRDVINTAGVLSAAIILTTAAPAQAANAVSDFIRSRQRQNGGSKLLAPLKVAQVRLQNASTLLETGTADGIKAALQAVRASSLNCYIFNPVDEDTVETRASIITQQLKFSDPCTFRIVVKSVTSFSPQNIKDEAQQLLTDLVISYEELDACLVKAQTNADSNEALQNAKQQLKTTQELAASIEALIAVVLDV